MKCLVVDTLADGEGNGVDRYGMDVVENQARVLGMIAALLTNRGGCSRPAV